MKFNHIPAYGFGRAKKCEIEKTTPLYNPGPGQYNPSSKGKHAPTWIIGKGQRGGQKRGQSPGPGTYSIPDKFCNGPKYSMATKAGAFDPTKTSFAPGPGQYNPLSNNRPSSAKYTMRAKSSAKNKEATPGPGNYNVRPDKIVVPSYKFGKDEKKGLEYANSRYVPGPGNYDYNADPLHEKYPKYSFGKEQRGNLLSNKTPGPGQYEYKTYLGKEAPKITMSAKFGYDYMNGDTKYVPGPGVYNDINTNKYRPKTPAYKIGTAERKGLYNSIETPGPGQYAPDSHTNQVRPKTPSWKIGTSKRGDLNPADKSTPGVGNYNIGKGLGAGPKYTIVGKGNSGDKKNGVPGPGQYNNSNAIYRKNPSWRIGSSQRDDDLKRIKREGVPGPGQYDFYDKTKVKAPQYKFGTEKRGAGGKNDTPGPGQYHIPCAIVDVNDYTREQGQFDPNYRYI